MLKRSICIALVLAVTGVAYAAAVRITVFDLLPDAPADAMAILNYSEGANKTIVQVIVSDFPPGGYDVILDCTPDDDDGNGDDDHFALDVMEVGQSGTGTVHITSLNADRSWCDLLLISGSEVVAAACQSDTSSVCPVY